MTLQKCGAGKKKDKRINHVVEGRARVWSRKERNPPIVEASEKTWRLTKGGHREK